MYTVVIDLAPKRGWYLHLIVPLYKDKKGIPVLSYIIFYCKVPTHVSMLLARNVFVVQ